MEERWCGDEASVSVRVAAGDETHHMALDQRAHQDEEQTLQLPFLLIYIPWVTTHVIVNHHVLRLDSATMPARAGQQGAGYLDTAVSSMLISFWRLAGMYLCQGGGPYSMVVNVEELRSLIRLVVATAWRSARGCSEYIRSRMALSSYLRHLFIRHQAGLLPDLGAYSFMLGV